MDCFSNGGSFVSFLVRILGHLSRKHQVSLDETDDEEIQGFSERKAPLAQDT